MNESGYDQERGAGDGNGADSEAQALEENLQEQLDEVRYTLSALNQKALRVMRDYPGACLLCAVGAGFLIGRLASRR